MGDIAMAVPVIKAFVQQHPTVKLTVLTRAFFKQFFIAIPNVNVFIPELKGKHKGFLGIKQLSKEVLALNIDAVVDLHDVLRSNLLIRFLKFQGVPYTQINKGRKEKKALVKPNKKVFKPLQSSHERYADAFRKLGFLLDLSQVDLRHDLPDYPSFLQDFKHNKLVAIAPFAAHKGKMYPFEKIEILIAQLSIISHVSIFLFGGGKEEKNLLNTLANKYDNVINMVGKVSFKEELSIIANMNLMISMDSGNGHLAAMYGVPVITIWGVTHPYAGFVPFNQPEINQIIPDLERYPKIPTSIYGNKYPEDYITCFDTINTDIIIAKCLNYI